MENEEKVGTPTQQTTDDAYGDQEAYLDQILQERRKQRGNSEPTASNIENQAPLFTQTPASDSKTTTVPNMDPAPIIRKKILSFPFGIILLCVLVAVVLLLTLPLTLRYSQQTGSLFDHDGSSSQMDLHQIYEVPDWITIDLLPVNPYSRPGTKLSAMRGAVVHYVGNPGTSAQQNRSYFAGLASSKTTYASSNFIIGLDGTILLLIPTDEVAYCSNQRNEDTLSIECCHPDDTGVFTEETYASLVRLLAWICNRFNLSTQDILRHYDITGKDCPRYYVANPDQWQTLLEDVEAAIISINAEK